MDKTEQVAHAQKAAALWAIFTKNEQTGVRFGMFPAEKMKLAEGDGFDGHQLSIALMNIASAKGGMRA